MGNVNDEPIHMLEQHFSKTQPLSSAHGINYNKTRYRRYHEDAEAEGHPD